jgi:hypothetical protein
MAEDAEKKKRRRRSRSEKEEKDIRAGRRQPSAVLSLSLSAFSRSMVGWKKKEKRSCWARGVSS